MIRVAPFWREDFERIRPRNDTAIGDLDLLRHCLVPEHARSGFLDDRPVACAGVVPLWPGVGQGWVVIDVSYASGAWPLITAMRRGLRDIAAEAPFHRIQAEVQTAFVQGQRLLKVLGFAHEGRLEAYRSDGLDYERYARIDRELIHKES